MMLVLAFVSEADTFAELRREGPQELYAVYENLSVAGKEEDAVQRPPRLWNQYATVIDPKHRTKNISEVWHNHFRIVIGKHQPHLYTLFQELQRSRDL